MTFDPSHLCLVIANGGAPGLPSEVGGADATGGTTGAGGGAGGAGAAPGGPFGNQAFLFVVFGMIALMLIFSLMAQRRDKKKRDKLISAIRKHQKVQTIGGVVGSVVDVRGEEVVLKVDESSNTRITFARSAIQQILNPEADNASGDS